MTRIRVNFVLPLLHVVSATDLARVFSAIPRGCTGLCPRRAPPQALREPPSRAALMRPDIIQPPPKYFNLMEKKIAIFSANSLKYTKECLCGSRTARFAFFLFSPSCIFFLNSQNILFSLSLPKNRKAESGRMRAQSRSS